MEKYPGNNKAEQVIYELFALNLEFACEQFD